MLTGNFFVSKSNAQQGLLTGLVAFERQIDDESWIYIRDISTGKTVQLTPGQTPDLSHDGTRIAFVSERSGNNQIYIINVDGTGLRLLNTGLDNNIDPVWSPDGTQIAFASNHDNRDHDIYKSNLNGDVTLLYQSGSDDRNPEWSPDGSKIAFTSGINTTHIYTMNNDGSDLKWVYRRIYDPVQTISWHPDGSMIAFNNAESGTLIRFNLKDGSSERNISAFNPAWSPDGDYIVHEAGIIGGNPLNQKIWTYWGHPSTLTTNN